VNCPFCSSDFNEETRAGLHIDVCSGCGSMFFDSGEFDAAAPLKEGTEDRLTRWVRPRGECALCGAEIDADDEEHCDVPLHTYCPRCGDEFYKVRTRTVRLEYCDGCGGFLLEPDMVDALAGRVAEPDPPPPPVEPDAPPGLLDQILRLFQ